MLEEIRGPEQGRPLFEPATQTARRRPHSLVASVIALCAAMVVLAVFGVGRMLDRLENGARTAERPIASRAAPQP